MVSVKQNISIDQGTTYQQGFSLLNANNEPYDTSSITAEAQMRKNYMSSNAVNFSTNFDSGKLILGLTSEVTANLVPGRYLYDIVIVVDSKTTRIVEGIATVTPAITR